MPGLVDLDLRSHIICSPTLGRTLVLVSYSVILRPIRLLFPGFYFCCTLPHGVISHMKEEEEVSALLTPSTFLWGLGWRMLEPLGLVGSVSRTTAGSCVCAFGRQLTGGSRSLDSQPSRDLIYLNMEVSSMWRNAEMVWWAGVCGYCLSIYSLGSCGTEASSSSSEKLYFS